MTQPRASPDPNQPGLGTLPHTDQFPPLSLLPNRWRIGKDDELISALTEPRFSCADDALDTIILTQTIHLCQLFLHLQEFDPCATDAANSPVPNDELLCVFQDALAREFNFAYGEALERIVRGLMLAQRQEPAPLTPDPAPAPSPAPSPAFTATTAPPIPRPQYHAQLNALLIRILRELNEPLAKHPLRYEQAYGARRTDSWAARFATRIMQWRFTVKYAPASLLEDVIEVQRHDVHPLDDEGLEVYRILRCTAPGLIHVVTPLHPETMQPRQSPPPPPPPLLPPQPQHQHHQHQHTASSAMKVQQMLGPPLAQTPGSSPSEGSDTPRTTPQFPQPPSAQQAEEKSRGSGSGSGSSSSVKRGSEDLGHLPPPLKRPRSTAEAAITDEIVVRGHPREDDMPPPRSQQQHQQQQQQASHAGAEAEVPKAQAEETNALLRHALEGIAELGRKIDGMQAIMDQRLGQLDEKLDRIVEWVGSED